MVKNNNSEVWNIYAIHTDHLNTPRLLTNQNGSEAWRWASDAFGDSQATGSIEFNLRFPGQYYDGESGLHYNYFRDYNAQTGRYVQSDPIGLQGGLNTYGYVRGNPLIYVDPTGEYLKEVIAIAGNIYNAYSSFNAGKDSSNQYFQNQQNTNNKFDQMESNPQTTPGQLAARPVEEMKNLIQAIGPSAAQITIGLVVGSATSGNFTLAAAISGVSFGVGWLYANHQREKMEGGVSLACY